MLDDLTAEEVVALAQVVRVADQADRAVFVGDTLTMLSDVPGVISLAKKINEAGKREDVQQYLEAHYEKKER